MLKANIGPVGVLTTVPTLSTSSDGQIFENLEIQDNVTINHSVTFRNCRIIGPTAAQGAGSATYTVRHIAGTGKSLTLENCEIITRYERTKGLVLTGNGGVRVTRTIFRGGADNFYSTIAGTNYFEGYGVVLRECWFGDIQRFPGSHSDCIQIDGGTGGALIERCRIMSYSITDGSSSGGDPYNQVADGTILGAGGVILTQNSSNPSLIDRVRLVDCWAEGGNYTIDTGPPDGLQPTNVLVSGTRFGVKHNFGPLHTGAGTTKINNTWGASGTTACCGSVTTGTSIP